MTNEEILQKLKIEAELETKDHVVHLKDGRLALGCPNLFVVLRYRYQKDKSYVDSSEFADAIAESETGLGNRSDHKILESTLEMLIESIKTGLSLKRIDEATIGKIYDSEDFMKELNNDLYDKSRITIDRGVKVENPSEKAAAEEKADSKLLREASEKEQQAIREGSKVIIPDRGTDFYEMISKRMPFLTKVIHFIKSLFTKETMKDLEEHWVNGYVHANQLTKDALKDQLKDSGKGASSIGAEVKESLEEKESPKGP
ncbi:hypothetical protein MMH89_00475 [Candidatus Comchoanobacter bicostacola]|uniref:Uncharacterized protein n=1 Tax=Candidatus Comchoanobacter bicostacola TaxID=2919598 RepID=A0ABY5DLH1_9GAMM|nr:hypothetical protein [Candidatus Comchoanobacter bicostacola]UTC24641.1 hypothetical protein MMH89_00475 [Candidatus Comchoanobacter bicostacola]